MKKPLFLASLALTLGLPAVASAQCPAGANPATT